MGKQTHSRRPLRTICTLVSLAALGLAPAALPPLAHAASEAPVSQPCCRVPTGSTVAVELVDEVSTKTYRTGDVFTLRLTAPLIVDGQVVLEAGTLGAGKVIDASGPGIGGKPAKLVLDATYLSSAGRGVYLNSLKLAGHGHDNSTQATLLQVGGIVSAPAEVAGVVLTGSNFGFKAGANATARVASDTVLPPLRPAAAADLAAVARIASIHSDEDVDAATPAAIPIPPPPPGQGQIVFFRAHTLLGMFQWFRVRENGKALGKLGNGAYFIRTFSPGLHTFTDKLEPELKDRLKLQVDPGETYFVEGTLTSGLILSAADLEPSSVDKFNKAIKSMGRKAVARGVKVASIR